MFIGKSAGSGNTSTTGNTSGIAIGNGAGTGMAGGTENVAIGTSAGTDVNGNTNYAIGSRAGQIITGADNYAMGIEAGQRVTGSQNATFGYHSGTDIAGSSNSAFGRDAGKNIVDSQNLALGAYAGQYTGVAGKAVENNIAIGTNANKFATGSELTTSGNTAIGANSVAKGAGVTTTDNNGNTTSTSATGTTVTNAAGDKTTIGANGITIAPAGKNAVSLTGDGLNNGGNKITNVADGTIGANSKDAVNGGQLHTALNNINTNIAAAKTVVTSNDGSVSIAPSTNGAGATVYDLAVKTDGTTITKAADGSLKANTTALTPAANGSIVAPTAADAGKLATAGDIANAINQAGFNLTTTASAGNVSGSSVERVNAGKTVTIDAGKNIRVTQNGNTVSIATQDNASFDSVTTGNTKIDNNGLTINGGPSVTQAGIDAAGNKITNVAPGTAPTDAVNVSQLNARLGATGQVAAAQLQQLENKIDQNQDRANAGIAGAIAQGTIPQVTRPSAFGLGVGTGYYGEQSALAVGASAMTDGGNWIFKGNFSVNTKGRVGAGAGALFQW